MIIRSNCIQNGERQERFLVIQSAINFYLISFEDSAEQCQIFIS